MNATILNREFQHPADGWYQIEPKGRHPNREAGVVQVIDEEAAASIVNRFNADAEAGTLRHGHELLIDHEHFSDQADKETIAYGWLQRLQNRGDGIYGQIRWSATGQKAVDGGDYRFFSTEYDPADCKVVNREAKEVRPLRLDGLSLTNMNNNRGQKPITNRTNMDANKEVITDEIAVQTLKLLNRILNGDYPGHEFHGNQFTGGEAHGAHNEASRKAHTASAEAHDKAGHQKAAAAHETAAAAQDKAGNGEVAEMHRKMASYHAARAARFKNRDFSDAVATEDREPNNETSMKLINVELGLAADSVESDAVAAIKTLKNRESEMLSDLIAAEFSAAGIMDEKIINRHRPLLSDPKHFKNRAERVAFIKDLVPQGKPQTKLQNRETRPPQEGKVEDAGGKADAAKATRIMNRASELVSQKRAPSLATAVTMAQNELENGS